MAKPQVLLGEHLKALRLPAFLREYDKVARQCAQEGAGHRRYLLRLSELELLDREQRATERRIKTAKFPVLKSLETFEFRSMPSLNKNLVLELARSEYLDRRENVLALGNSGTGKTHLALALGWPLAKRVIACASPRPPRWSMNCSRHVTRNVSCAYRDSWPSKTC